jgi:hypothetical protein
VATSMCLVPAALSAAQATAAGADTPDVAVPSPVSETTVTTCGAYPTGIVPSQLLPGGAPSIASGGCLFSPNGQYFLHMQTDGNLVLYVSASDEVLWSSGTNGNNGAIFSLQSNGFMGVLNSTSTTTCGHPASPGSGAPSP